jgi:uncharacterized membrane protein
MLFAIGAVSRIGSPTGRLITWVSALLGLISIAVFLYLIDYAARLLRPVTIVWRVGEEGMAVIDSVYPNPINDTDSAQSAAPMLGEPDRVNIQALIDEARRADAVLEFVPCVGDFVAAGEPLFRLFGKDCAI